MRTVSKNTVTAVCVAADVQDFDYVATILNAYVNLTPTPAPPVVTEAPRFTAYDESYGNIKDGAWVPYRVVREFDTEAERDAWVAYNPMHRGRLQHAASERVSKSYTLPDTVQAIVDAAAAYEKEHGRYQDYRLSLRDNVFPVDKTERAIVVAYRKHAASEVRG